MRPGRQVPAKTVLIGVTVDYSLQFHAGLPEDLVHAGWEVHVVASPGNNLSLLSRLHGVTTHELTMARSPNPLRDLVSLWKWIALLRRLRPAIALIGTPKASLLGHLAGRISGVPRRIYMIHGLRYESAKGPSRALLRFFEKLTCQWATEVIAVSKSLRNVAIHDRLASPARLLVIGSGSSNGVDLDLFSPTTRGSEGARNLAEELSLDPRLPTVGFVGRLTRDKGLPELAAALRLLADQAVAVQVLVVGGIDDRSGLSGLHMLRQTGQKIVDVPFTDEIWRFYAVMDVLCSPSLREGLPTVVLEAMASGVVVVGTDATGMVDLIEHGVTGLRVPRGSSRELAVALRNAIDDHDLAHRLRTAARDLVSREFDARAVRAQLCEHIIG